MKINSVPGAVISFGPCDPQIRQARRMMMREAAKNGAKSAGTAAGAAVAVSASEILVPIAIGGLICYGIYKLFSD